MIYIGLCVGNIVGPQVRALPPTRALARGRADACALPQLYKTSESPYYKTGLTGNLIILCILSGFIAITTLYLQILNKRNIKRRQAAGKTGQNIDYSLVSSSKWESMRGKQLENAKMEGVKEVFNGNAFKDL